MYNFRCYYCHGYSGDARTLAATYLKPIPRDFSRSPLEVMSRERMIASVSGGVEGTAMKSFANTLSAGEIEQVVDFIREEFMRAGRENTRYHTRENGWPDHERYRIAYPFASGEVALDTSVEALSDEQLRGRGLFLTSCITCHDRARVEDEGAVWQPHAISYPRGGYSHRPEERFDAVSRATPYAVHDRAPSLEAPTSQEQRGERLFQENCAFCHANDGTGKNWIGTFLQPHPRNLTDPDQMAGMSRSRLRRVIEEGLPGTTMPAWHSVLDGEEIEALIVYIDRAFYRLER